MIDRSRVGYFGGTFDPPHLGHEILAVEAYFQLHLEKLNWLLTPDPPHKQGQGITPAADRLKMLDLVVSRYPGFEVSRLDLDRDPPHYAADTAEIIKERFPGNELVYIIGEDSLHDLPAWHEPERLLAAVDILAVAPRPGIAASLPDLERALPGILEKTIFLDEVMVEISSSVIRERIQQGAPYRHFLSREINLFLDSNLLYRRAA